VLIPGGSARVERQRGDTGRARDRERGIWEFCGFVYDPRGR
jgi:hypothetical protein